MTKAATADNRKSWSLVALATTVIAMLPASLLVIRG